MRINFIAYLLAISAQPAHPCAMNGKVRHYMNLIIELTTFPCQSYGNCQSTDHQTRCCGRTDAMEE